MYTLLHVKFNFTSRNMVAHLVRNKIVSFIFYHYIILCSQDKNVMITKLN